MMQTVALFVVALFVVGLVAYACGQIIIALAERLNLQRAANGRSAHVGRVPHGAGLGVFVAFWLGMTWAYLSGRCSADVVLALLAGSVIVALISLCDDLSDGVSRRVRLSFHFLGVAIPLSFLHERLGFAQAEFPVAVVSALALIVGLAWWINLFNFMDGIDGLAGIEALSLAIGFSILGLASDTTTDLTEWLLIASLLGASVMGFLFLNWSPAKIFLGDVGSIFLGFATGMIALLGWTWGVAPVWSWVILSGVFFVDATYTLMRRIWQREAWQEAHSSHAYQVLSRHLAGLTDATEPGSARARALAHRRVSAGAGMVTLLWLLPLALAAQRLPQWGMFICLIGWAPLITVAATWSRRPVSSTASEATGAGKLEVVSRH